MTAVCVLGEMVWSDMDRKSEKANLGKSFLKSERRTKGSGRGMGIGTFVFLYFDNFDSHSDETN